MSDSSNNRRALLGVAIVLLGIFLLLKNFNLIPFFLPGYLFSWGALFIFAGLFALGNRENKMPGFVLITIGTIHLLPEIFGISRHDAWATFWPVILVMVGISIILRRKMPRTAYSHTSRWGTSSDASAISMDTVDEVAIFSGGERVITSSNFRGGRITTIFGGLEINLLGCELAPGNNVIDLFTIFGGTEFTVPSDWHVKSEVFAIFGGFSDKRRFATDYTSSATNTLILRGIVLFGGGEIKNISLKKGI